MEDKVIIVESNERAIMPAQEPRSRRGFTVKTIIDAWLDNVSTRSGSPKTRKAYEDTIYKFRGFLQENGGYELIPTSPEQDTADYVVALSDYAQVFIKLRSPDSKHKGNVSPSTKAQRSAILSSFYRYCIKKRHITAGNPIDYIDRAKVDKYAKAQAIEPPVVARQLEEIDTSTVDGLRNLALLSVLLFTGRRVSEVQALRREHVEVLNNKQIKLHFEKAKGGKQFRDTLSPEVSALLSKWLNMWYRNRFGRMPPDTPLWVDVEHPSRATEPLGYHGIAGVVNRHLGTTKVHTTRHTFAMLMIKAGASITDIQGLLGHENAATTGEYLDALSGGDNPYAKELTKLLGLTRKKQK